MQYISNAVLTWLDPYDGIDSPPVFEFPELDIISNISAPLDEEELNLDFDGNRIIKVSEVGARIQEDAEEEINSYFLSIAISSLSYLGTVMGLSKDYKTAEGRQTIVNRAVHQSFIEIADSHTISEIIGYDLLKGFVTLSSDPVAEIIIYEKFKQLNDFYQNFKDVRADHLKEINDLYRANGEHLESHLSYTDENGELEKPNLMPSSEQWRLTLATASAGQVRLTEWVDWKFLHTEKANKIFADQINLLNKAFKRQVAVLQG